MKLIKIIIGSNEEIFKIFEKNSEELGARIPLRRKRRISRPRGWIMSATLGSLGEGMSTRALGHRPTFDLTTRSAPVCTSTTAPFSTTCLA